MSSNPASTAVVAPARVWPDSWTKYANDIPITTLRRWRPSAIPQPVYWWWASRRACTAPTVPAGRSPAITPAYSYIRHCINTASAASRNPAAGDGLQLMDCRITNAVKCLPPANKPLPAEMRECNRYLQAELRPPRQAACSWPSAASPTQRSLRAFGLKSSEHAFAHGAEYALPLGRHLLDSYHCSRYNTQTRRLTAAMFEKVLARARELGSLVNAMNAPVFDSGRFLDPSPPHPGVPMLERRGEILYVGKAEQPQEAAGQLFPPPRG